MRGAALEDPCKDESQPVDIAVRKDRVAEIGPAVAHEVGAFKQVGGVSQTEGVTHLVKRHPADVLWVVRGNTLTGWGNRTDQNVVAFVIPTDRIPREGHPAGCRNVVQNDIDASPLVLRARHILQRDRPIEAIIQHGTPGGNCIVDRVELRLGSARVSLNRHCQVSMIPPVARIVIAEDFQRLRIRLGQIASGTAARTAGRFCLRR